MGVISQDQQFHLQDHEVEIFVLIFGSWSYLHQCVFWSLPAVDCDLFMELKYLDVQILSGVWCIWVVWRLWALVAICFFFIVNNFFHAIYFDYGYCFANSSQTLPISLPPKIHLALWVQGAACQHAIPSHRVQNQVAFFTIVLGSKPRSQSRSSCFNIGWPSSPAHILPFR